MTTIQDPIEKFMCWWREARQDSPLKQKNAVCVSTIDEDGFPQGRFVDLKHVSEDGFVFCTELSSPKGQHIKNNDKTAMTIWWDHVGYQVRIVGVAEPIATELADHYWQTRSLIAQLVTTSFSQSECYDRPEELEPRLDEASLNLKDQTIARPETWGGFCVNPKSIEFLHFAETRLHIREKYIHCDGHWLHGYIQP